MIYLSVFIILLIISFIEVITKNNYKNFFKIIFVILAALTILRYGVGTDYFNYNVLYNSYSPLGSSINYTEHGEIGFKLLAKVFKTLNIHFIFFSMFISTVTCIFIYISIKKESKYYNFSLLIMYTIFWFTYINSGIRQGLALSICLYSLVFLQKKEFLKYIFLILISSMFHQSALVMLVLPVIFFINTTQLLLLLSISFMIPILNFINIDIFGRIFNLFGIEYYSGNTFSISAISLRIFILCFILFIYFFAYSKKDTRNDFYLKISLLGYILYFILSGNDLVASRIHAYFKLVEIILIPNMIFGINSLKNRLILYISYSLIFLPMFYYKEVSSQIDQGLYYNTSVFKYPYTNIFNDINDLKNIRYIKNSHLIE